MRHAQHAVHRCADLVADHGQELALGAQRILHSGCRLFERAGALLDRELELGSLRLQALIGLEQFGALAFEQLLGLLARLSLALHPPQQDLHLVVGRRGGPALGACGRQAGRLVAIALIAAHARSSVKRTRLPESADTLSRPIASDSRKCWAQPWM